jgi:hypothetical protein
VSIRTRKNTSPSPGYLSPIAYEAAHAAPATDEAA